MPEQPPDYGSITIIMAILDRIEAKLDRKAEKEDVERLEARMDHVEDRDIATAARLKVKQEKRDTVRDRILAGATLLGGVSLFVTLLSVLHV